MLRKRIPKLNWINRKSSVGRSVALGTFDGVHLGHQKLIHEAVHRRPQAGSSCVFTFDVPPEQYFKGNLALLTSFDQKVQRIQGFGIDEVAWLPFSEEISSLEAEQFVESLLVEQLQVREVVCGFDYRFGKQRRGDVEFLRQCGREFGFGVTVVEAVEAVSGEVISSTKIRGLLAQGELEKAVSFLGAYPSYVGQVVRGAGRGRLLGFPTANLQIDPSLVLPGEGVYLTWSLLGSDLGVPSVTSIGKNPTFAGEVQTMEAFILDFSGDLYGQELEIQFLARLRDIERYESIQQLRAQIEADVEQARQMLAGFHLQDQRIVLE